MDFHTYSIEKGKERRTSHTGRSAIYIRNDGARYSGTDFFNAWYPYRLIGKCLSVREFRNCSDYVNCAFTFQKKVSGKLWISILFITVSSIILSFEDSGSFQFSMGSLFVLLATVCWGLENNCTRKISEKSTFQIVTIKGLCCGTGSFLIATIIGESLPKITYIALAMILGFAAYGLSIFLYIKAQRDLGAAKTSAYYSIAPFIGTFLAFIVNGEELTAAYFLSLFFMIIGTLFVVADTLMYRHMTRQCFVTTPSR